jgi:hypothetical protein
MLRLPFFSSAIFRPFAILTAEAQDVCNPPNSGPMMKQIASSLCKQKHSVRPLLPAPAYEFCCFITTSVV